MRKMPEGLLYNLHTHTVPEIDMPQTSGRAEALLATSLLPSDPADSQPRSVPEQLGEEGGLLAGPVGQTQGSTG